MERLVISLSSDASSVQTVDVRQLDTSHVAITMRRTRVVEQRPGRYSPGDDDVMYLPATAAECRRLAAMLSIAASAIESTPPQEKKHDSSFA